MSIIVAILILGVLIFVHELGHFLIAKLCGVGVHEFAIGFGPVLFRRVIGETEYALRAIPLGGFVRMMGESREDDQAIATPEEQAKSFSRKGYWAKVSVVAAGPAFNLIFALMIGFFAYLQFGASEPSEEPRIGEVMAGYPAEKAGLKSGDLVRSINGQTVATWEELAKQIFESKGGALNFEVLREDKPLSITVTGEKEKIEEAVLRGESEISDRFKVGIVASINRIPVTPTQAAKYATLQIWGITVMTFRGISGMVNGLISPEHIAGPIFIVSEAARSAKRGVEYIFDFMVFMSVSLALLNLLPIPVLDGGHLLVFTIEAIFRKPLGERIQGIATNIGFGFLLLLTLFAVSNDLRRLIG